MPALCNYDSLLQGILEGRAPKAKDVAKLSSDIKKGKRSISALGAELETDEGVEMLLAYLINSRKLARMERILRIIRREAAAKLEKAWERGKVKEAQLGDEEKSYLEKYKSICAEYFAPFPGLTASELPVPVDYYVHAKAVAYCGVVRIGRELVEVDKGLLYYVRKKDIAHLITQGRMLLVD